MTTTYELAGNLHMHTPYSDGEKWHKQIAEAAINAGLDFVVVTDHNIWVDGVEGYYQNSQGRVLLLIGEEVHDNRRLPQCNHFLVYGAEQEMCRHAHDSQKLIQATRQANGHGFLAHPFEDSLNLLNEPELGWHDWQVQGFTGLEIWNYMSSFKTAIAQVHQKLPIKNKTVGKLAALPIALHPEKYITTPDPRTLAKWDELLQQNIMVAAIGNSDAHGTRMHLGAIQREIFPYEFLFRAVNTHILTTEPLNGDLAHDKAVVLRAIGQGNSWVGYDMPHPTKGFRFGVYEDAGIALGNKIITPNPPKLEAHTPTRCCLRLIHNGKVVAQADQTSQLFYTPTESGYYRLEATIPYLGQERGWIYSNPIYLLAANGNW